MDFQPIRKESLLMIYDDFSREFYRLLMNLNHELQMSLENQHSPTACGTTWSRGLNIMRVAAVDTAKMQAATSWQRNSQSSRLQARI